MDYPQAYVSISMLLIFIFIGLPLWWNTTKVYRASLPISKIDMLQNSSFKLKINVKLYSQKDIKEFVLKNTYQEILLEYSKYYTEANDFEKCCDNMNKQTSANLSYSFCFLQSSDTFTKGCPHSLNTVISLTTISNIEVISHVENLLSVYLPFSKLSPISFKNSKLPLSPGYQINFVLAVAEPEEFVEDWKPQEAVDIFRNYLKHFEFLEPITFSSQVLYYPAINQKPKKSGNLSYYVKSKLSHIINPLESRLNTYVTLHKTLQFVIYVPPREHSPLYIRRQKTGKNENPKYEQVAFHSPRWGGICFYNRDRSNLRTVLPNDFIMIQFLNQFNELVGVELKDFEKVIDNFGSSFFYPYKRLKIIKLFEHLYTSLSTLKSLSKLLNEIPNIVIGDEIAGYLKESVAHIEMAITNMNHGLLDKAFDSAKQSYVLSEKAFFDASLLGLLYFPDDQKYAIYVPLFLPISIPVVISCYKAFKMLKESWAKEKTKSD